MKLLKHWYISLLSIVFLFGLPLFHNQVFASSVTEFSITTNNAQPFMIASSSGSLWFTEEAANKIGNMTTGGSVTEYTIPTSNSQPIGITAGPDGNVWFTEVSASKIGKITPNGTFTEYATPTSNSGPEGITVGPDGNLWFTEATFGNIGKITTSGTITEYPIPTSSGEPNSITTGSDGNLWFTENVGKIGKITTSGTVTEYTLCSSTLCFPTSITAGPDGNLWFTENGFGKIGKITTSGTITTYSSSTSPYSITTGPDGNLWFTGTSNSVIGRITPSGTLLPVFTTIYGNQSTPYGITTGPDGNMWFADTGVNSIGRVVKYPLVLIPGMMGSNFAVKNTFDPQIYDCTYPNSKYQYNQGDKVWFKTGNLNPYRCGQYQGNQYLDVLKLQPDGQTNTYRDQNNNPFVGLDNSLVNDSLLFQSVGYRDTLQYLTTSAGYTLGKDFFVFPYDWRQDAASSEAQLEASISAILSQTGASKVDIMTHSMGGLLARDYISNTTRAANVDTLVELGTPHAGTPQFLDHLLYPTCIRAVGIVCAVNGTEVNKLVQNFPGAFELLPSSKYYQLYNNDTKSYPFSQGSISSLTPFTYSQLKTYLLSTLNKNSTVYTMAENFHNAYDSLSSDSNGVINGVQDYLIAGSSKPTIGQIHDYGIFQDAEAIDGDGTVATRSATLSQQDTPQNNVFFVNQKHEDLVANGSGLSLAANLVNRNTNTSGLSVQKTTYGFNGGLMWIYSPATLDAYDNLGNHTGATSSGAIEENIPGSIYNEVGEAKFIYLPTGGNYHFTTKATGTGSFSLRWKTYQNSVQTQELVYLNVAQTANTTSSLTMNTSAPVLSVDVNGDGTNIQSVSPVTLTGSAMSDFLPPVTSSSLSPAPNSGGGYSNPVTVTLTASASAGFTIAHTYYTVDGGSQQTYSSPFTVSGFSSHTITYWSVDNEGLTEATNTKTFTIGNALSISIDNTGNSNTLTDYQIATTLNTASLISAGTMRSDCGDIRFTDSDGITAINNYFVENCNNSATKIWVKVPSIPASSSKTITLSYGNSSNTSLSSASNTFIRDIANLQGAWPLEETGTTAHDNSGNGDNGTITGTTAVSGKFTNARNFSGNSTDKVDISNQTGIPYGSNARSVCSWVKANTHGSDWMFFFGQGSYNTNQAFAVGKPSGSDQLGLAAFNNTLSSSGSFWNDTNWHFVCATYDGTTATLYGDNSQLAQNTESYNTSTGADLILGSGPPTGYPWYGALEQVSMYSRALSTNEMTDLYNNYGYATPNYANHELVRKFSNPEPIVMIGTGTNGETYKRSITIDNTGNANTLTNYQVSLVLDTASLISASKMQSNCGDIRFTDSDGTTTLSYYWVENCNNSNTKIWVRVPSIAASASKTIYLYYGNSSAMALSSTTHTFVDDISSLQGHWSLEESSGTTAHDSSGNGDNGTITGTTVVTGKFTNARNFNGANSDNVDISTQTGIPYGSNARSVCSWAKADTHGSNWMFFFGQGSYNTNQAFAVGKPSGSDQLGLAAFNNTLTSTSSFWGDTNWHYVCATYDGATATLYGDGSQLAQSAESYNTSTGADLILGSGPPTGYPWYGSLEQVTMFSQSLTSTQITNLYNNYGYATSNYANHELVKKFTSPDVATTVGSEGGI